jgi:hypothetical protein
MVPIRQSKVALQHPTWGDVSSPTPGAEGTALLLFGQKPTSRRSARSHPAWMMRLKNITAHRAPQSVCPKPCGFREAPTPGKSTLLGPTFTASRTGQTGGHSGVRGTRNSISGPTLHSHPHPRNLHQVQRGLHTSLNGQLCVCIRESIGSVYTSALLAIYPSECYATRNFLERHFWTTLAAPLGCPRPMHLVPAGGRTTGVIWLRQSLAAK